VYWAAGGHLYRSADKGTTWADQGTVEGSDSVRVDAVDENSVYVAALQFTSYTGPWHSSDGGTTWAAIAPTMFQTQRRIGFNAHPLLGGTIDLLLYDTPTPPEPIWDSIDAGASWSEVAVPIPGAFAIGYGDNGRRYAVSSTMFTRFSASGAIESQQDVSSFGIGPVQGVVVAPSNRAIIYLPSQNGLFRSTLAGE
jgi:hypothetical protein